MRKPTDMCLLCQKKPSDKKNSHVIPKFFGKGLFDGTKPRHGIQISRNGVSSKVQDIIKENYILCSECEKGLSIFETYCTFRLERFNNILYHKQYKRFKRVEFQYFECNNLDIRIFNLFIYSIVWRISISEHNAFQKFQLPIVEEEKLRKVIKDNISKTQNELIDNLGNFSFLPDHSHAMIRPSKKLRPPNSMLSAASLDESIHQLHLVDYLIFYATDKEKLISNFNEINNNNIDRKVRIGLIDSKLWSEFNLGLMYNLWK